MCMGGLRKRREMLIIEHFFSGLLIFFETDVPRAGNHIIVTFLNMQNITGTADTCVVRSQYWIVQIG